jgi:hypothetical protein
MASKRDEAKFMKGELGVDGQAVADERTPEEAELAKAQEALLRGRTWLGRECLTWLLWKSESTEPVVAVKGIPLTVVFNGKLTLRAGAGEVTETQVKGVAAPYAKLVKHAIAKGLLVHAAKVQLTWGEQVYDLQLDAEFFDIRSAKLPSLIQEEEGERLTERLELATRASTLVDALVEEFARLRASRSWDAKIVPGLLEWLEDR